VQEERRGASGEESVWGGTRREIGRGKKGDERKEKIVRKMTQKRMELNVGRRRKKSFEDAFAHSFDVFYFLHSPLLSFFLPLWERKKREEEKQKS